MPEAAEGVVVSENSEPVEPWLVALDIDGTVLGYDGELSPAVKDAVGAAVQAGHQIVLASGRDLVGMLPLAKTLGLHQGWLVCSNGCVVVRLDPDFGAGYWIEQVSVFDADPILHELAAQLPTARFAVEVVGSGYRVTELFNEGELAGNFDVVPVDQLSGGGLVTRVIVRGGDEAPEAFHDAIASLGLTDVGYFIGFNAWMDIAPQGVSKASALEHVRELLAIPAEHTMAVGDGHNDIPMIQWAARGVAMGQADLEVRTAADEVTAPVTKDGVKEALRPLLPTR
jgi:hydroxymethylpyrimidine pyrophosphatase-like HAD family hydrolase